jgi:hypothetical protein
MPESEDTLVSLPALPPFLPAVCVCMCICVCVCVCMCICVCVCVCMCVWSISCYSLTIVWAESAAPFSLCSDTCR